MPDPPPDRSETELAEELGYEVGDPGLAEALEDAEAKATADSLP